MKLNQEYISHFQSSCRNQQSIRASVNESAKKNAKSCYQYSMIELAAMDKAGLKLDWPYVDYGMTDRGWAE